MAVQGSTGSPSSRIPKIPPLSSTPALEDDSVISSFMKTEPATTNTKKADDTPSPSQQRVSQFGNRSSDNMALHQGDSQTTTTHSRIISLAPLGPIPPLRSPDRLGAGSPGRSPHPVLSPSISALSPRPHSPASSQIFERNVQEEVLPAQASPQIPSHIMTENHIPPVLEEASAAITDKKLDPDAVEIVTSNLHQPAAFAVTGTPAGEQSLASSMMEESGFHRDLDESRSNIASIDAVDVRRLSFVSFADVVHAEQAAEAGDMGSIREGIAASQKSTSPLQSPTSSHHLGTSPPTSVSPPHRVDDLSPGQAGHPMPNTQLGGELNVETMRQALRKTNSREFHAGRSGMLSAGTLEE